MASFPDPGTWSNSPGGRLPTLDLDHLGRQTFGDGALAREVLQLFAAQARQIQSRIDAAPAPERFELAHALKGAARAIGAFELAAGLSAVESRPDDRTALSRIGALIDEVCALIAAHWPAVAA